MGGKKLNIKPGDMFEYLEIIKEVDKVRPKSRRFLIRCTYDNCNTIKEMNYEVLSKSKSCGCFKKKNGPSKTHGLSKHPIYSLWSDIKRRCSNPNRDDYYLYGGRGIEICDEWKNNFQLFYDWAVINKWQKGLQIDRIDNDGNYEPDNCHFVTNQVNSLNKRLLSSNNKSGYCGVYYCNTHKYYKAQVRYKNKKAFTKSNFKTPQAAAIARDSYIIENELPHKLNFNYVEPNLSSQNGWIF